MATLDNEPLLRDEGRARVRDEEELGAARTYDGGLELPEHERRHLYAPISYEQATTPPRPVWHPLRWASELRQHQHILDVFAPSTRMRDMYAKASARVSAFWPQNRMQQAVLVMLLLWISVTFADYVVSGASRPSDSFVGGDDNLYWSFSGKLAHALRHTSMHPIPGDGTLAQNATWGVPECRSTGEPLRFVSAIRCRASSNFTLDAVPRPDSSESNDHLFLYVDPNRSRTTQNVRRGSAPEEMVHGSVPAEVGVFRLPPNDKLPEPQRGKVFVHITAYYDEQARPLLDASLVGKLFQNGGASQGIEILTPPIERMGIHHRDSLRFDIAVGIPAGQEVSAFMVETSGGTVDLFSPSAQRDAPKAHALQAFAPPPGGEVPEQRFGKVYLESHSGAVTLGSRVRATEQIHARTYRGSIEVAAGTLTARHVTLQNSIGAIALHRDARLVGLDTTTLTNDIGAVHLDEGAQVWGSGAIRAETQLGAVAGHGTWNVNHTLSITTTAGIIAANVSVEKPDLDYVDYAEAKKPGKGRRIETHFFSQLGGILVNYTSHVPTVPLYSNVKSLMGGVHVIHPRVFEGHLQANGSTAAISAPALEPGRHLKIDSDERKTLQEVLATCFWDKEKRPQLPSSYVKQVYDDGTPPLENGAASLAFSQANRAQIEIA